MKRLLVVLMGSIVLQVCAVAAVAAPETVPYCPYLDGTLRPFYDIEFGLIQDVRVENRGGQYAQMALKVGADLVYFHNIAAGDVDVRLRFDHVLPMRKAAIAVPDHLMALALETRWFWRYANRLAFELLVSPGVYASTDDILDMPLGMPFRAAGVYTFDPTLALVAGLHVRPSFYHTFVPYGGVVWHPYPQLRVDATVPDARVTFYLDREWSGYAGWSWESNTYHVEADPMGRNRFTLSVHELYLGASRMITDEFRVTGSMGWSMNRDIHMTRGRSGQRESLAVEDTLILRVGVAGAF